MRRLSGKSLRSATLSWIALAMGVIVASESQAQDNALARRAFMGVRVGPVSDEAREQLKLEADTGLTVMNLVPGSSAEGILQPDDVIVSVNGQPIRDALSFVKRIGSQRGGDRLKIAYWREGQAGTAEITLKEMPRETSDAYDVTYDSVVTKVGRLRTIISKPKGPAPESGKRPALLIVQGIGYFTIEKIGGGLTGYPEIADAFARNGYVVMRMDKAGCGDSEGGPFEDVDFETQLDGFRQALKALKAHPDVDPDKVLIFGHSMGGVWGPKLIQENPVRGIAVYGTALKPWPEYLVENKRRQLKLAKVPEAEIDADIAAETAANRLVLEQKMSPEEAAKKQPELAEWLRANWTQGKYYVGCHYRFFQQLADLKLDQIWAEYPGQVLAIWGKGDFVSAEADHERIAQIVNGKHPGHGRFLALDGIDHGFLSAASQEESFRDRLASGASVRFNPAIIDELRAWADQVIKS